MSCWPTIIRRSSRSKLDSSNRSSKWSRLSATGGRRSRQRTRLAPDILVLDISMPIVDGIETIRSLRATGSRSKFVFLTVHGDEDYVRAGLAAGAVGYVVKSRLASDLLPALREALAGRRFISPSLSQG